MTVHRAYSKPAAVALARIMRKKDSRLVYTRLEEKRLQNFCI